MRSPSSALPALLICIVFAACSGSDSPAGPGGTDPVEKADPSFGADIWEVLQRNSCSDSTCHGGGEGGLTLATAAGAYSNLVNVASPASGEIRVIPGNANDSYLVKKLEGRQSVGVRMPVGSQLSSTDLANVKNWINQGAKNN